jgi:organic hydroperoxide reductase OsmC/OhrA
MAHQFRAHVVWTGAAQGPAVTYDGYSREYLVEIDGKPPLRGSSAPVYMGDAGLHNPEDLLVTSLSACHMLWYLHLCTEAGIHVSGYIDDAEGDPERALALHQQASEACFITSVTVANNLVTARILARDGNPTSTTAGNLENASTSLFVDLGTADLHLAPAAFAAIDQGDAVHAAPAGADIDGDPRTGAPDIGADER